MNNQALIRNGEYNPDDTEEDNPRTKTDEEIKQENINWIKQNGQR